MSLRPLILLPLLAALAVAVPSAGAATTTFTVTTTADSGPGSLRKAILDANGSGTAAMIAFAIPGAGVHTIAPTSALPLATVPLTVDARTQPGYAGFPLIGVDGTSAAGADGIVTQEPDSTVAGVAVTNFVRGVELGYRGRLVAGYVGLEPDGTTAGPNATGVYCDDACRIGGTAPGDGNVVSANGDGVYLPRGGVVEGNLIGTTKSGLTARANTNGVVVPAGSLDVRIGGTDPAARNVIAGNTTGISIQGRATVLGNRIGVNVAGSVLANHDGVSVTDGTGTVIGGKTAASGNVISGNTIGVHVFVSRWTTLTVQHNLIGTDPTGTAARPNTYGVEIVDAGDNRIGPGNTISGNTNVGVAVVDLSASPYASENRIVGNRIGTDVTGLAALPNGTGISNESWETHIGGSKKDGNLISGNTGDGILLKPASGGAVISGNTIGASPAGTVALPNGGIGVHDQGASTRIGDYTRKLGNLISGNGGDGVALDAGATSTFVGYNRIGTDAKGAVSITNGGDGVDVQDNASVTENLVSGNAGDGLRIHGAQASTAFVVRNRIGTEAKGTVSIPNGGNGISVTDAPNVSIGDNDPKDGNLISGNTQAGISSSGTSPGLEVKGNTIGADAKGKVAVPNAIGVLVGSASALVGNQASPNLISGNTVAGIVATSTLTSIGRNFVGTGAKGRKAIPNGTGIAFLSGGTGTLSSVPSLPIVVSGNANAGISVCATCDGVVIQDTLVGLDAARKPLGNGGDGIFVAGSGALIGGPAGTADEIAWNGSHGVEISAGVHDTVAGNAIHDNGGLGIALVSGGNNALPAPTASNASTTQATFGASGLLHSTQYTIEVFANGACDPGGAGEGERFLGQLQATTSAGGVLLSALALPPGLASGDVLTATLIEPGGNTSGFSTCVTV